MNWFNSVTVKKDNTILIVCGINILFSILYLIINMRNYSDYQSMIGVLNGISFIYMAVFQIVILTGLVLMFFGNKKGFYIYIIGQVISLIYPIATGTVDTVWGLLILPVLIVPIPFAIFYYRNLNKMY
jgi:hypothetical protein